MSDQQATKRCGKCQVEQPRSEFYPRRNCPHGLQPWCKSCHRKIAAQWNRTHPDQHRAWRRDNRDRERETTAAWRKANPKKQRLYGKKWVSNNRDKVRQKLARRRALKRATTVDPRNIAAFYRMVRNADRLTCYWCDKVVPKSDRHVDHIIPLSRHGAHAVLNLCCSCSSCNHRKRHKLPSEFTGQHELFA